MTRAFGPLRSLPALVLPLATLALALALAIAFVAPSAALASAPGGMGEITLTRTDGQVTASWDAPSGATKYHVTYSDDGGSSWHAPVDNHTNVTATSITFAADNAKTYVVGVRAGNDNGQWSGWRNSPPAGPWNAPPPPDAVASVTVTRSDGSLTASWDAPANAAAYHVTYNDGTGWHAPVDNHTNIEATSLTFDADNAKTYVVGVRARNSADAWSGWVNSPSSGPYTPPAPEPTPTPTPTPTPEPTPTPTPTPPPPAAPSGLTATPNDGSVTLSWGDPADASITGYEYNVNHNDTSTGNLSGWGPWTAIAGSGADTTSHTFSDLVNGREYRYHVRAVNGAGAGTGAPNAPPWFAAAVAGIPVPAAPDNFAVDPGNGYRDLSWNAVEDATAYDIRARESGVNDWHSVANKVTGTSYRYTTDKTIDHVAVRAVNEDVTGPWAELSRLPDHGWLNTVQSSGASMASAQSQSQLTAPSWGTITRANSSIDEKLYLNWGAVTGATGYNLVCSDTNGWDNQWPCGTVGSGATTSLTVDEMPAREGKNNTPVDLVRTRSYTVWVRAVTGNPADASGWTESAQIRPVHQKVTNLNVARANGSIMLSWTPNPWTTGYEVLCAVPGSPYTSCATLTNQDDTATSHSVTISSWTAGGTNYSIDNTKTYDLMLYSSNTWGKRRMEVPLIRPITLTASNVSATGATLTLRNYTGSWWLKPTTPADAACESMGTATKKDLSDLADGNSYTYKAYSDSACTNEIVSASFTTQSFPSVSNLGKASDGIGVSVHSNDSVATGFTTGGNSSGYTLRSATLKFRSVGASPSDSLTVGIHAATGGNPAASATHALSGDDPTGAGEYIFTCSGDCSLSKDTPYFLVLTGNGEGWRRDFNWDTTASTSETNTPGTFGWSIADAAKTQSRGSWSDAVGWTGIFKVSATLTPSLTASNVAATTATLTIASHGGGNWYYKHTNTGATCDGPVSGTSKDLTGLTAGTSYTYSAYSDSTCTNANLLATAASFTTLPPPGSRDSSKDINPSNTEISSIWSDGTTMWVTHYDYGSQTGDILAVDLATGNRDTSKEFTLHSNDGKPLGIWGNSTTIYVQDQSDTYIYAYNRSTKARDTSKEFDLHTDTNFPYDIWSDGTTMWVADLVSNKFHAYILATGARDSAKDLTTTNISPVGIWSDGTTMWVSDYSKSTLYAYKRSDKSRDSSKDYALTTDNDSPYGIWSNDTTMYVADDDGNIYAYHTIVP